MKIRQVHRWKRRTIQEQNLVSQRLIGRIFWSLLLLGGVGSVAFTFLSDAKVDLQQTSTLSPVLSVQADEKLTASSPLRNLFLRTVTESTQILGGNRVGDVYLTEERLLEYPQKLDSDILADTANAINTFYRTYEIPTAVIAVPSAGEFYADDLSDGTPFPSQLSEIDAFYQAIDSPIRKIDVYHVLFTATEDYIYYRTDEKWSSCGAYYVYRNAVQRMGFAPISYDQYAVSHVAAFRGNLYHACLSSHVTSDILDIYYDENGSKVTEMTAYSSDGTSEKRTYLEAAEDETIDPDTFYLGEPCEKLVIRTDLDNQKKLLLIKDSYADSMVPFLLQHYSEICVLDVREIKHSLSELADTSEYTQVLILCDADTFAEKGTADIF